MKQKYYSYSIIIGILISIMITFNGILSSKLGNSQAILFIHIIGIITIVTFMKIKKTKLNSIKNVPKYLLFPGMIGVVMVTMNNLTVNNIGLSLTVACGVFGQMLFSSIVDHFGLFGNEVYKFNKNQVLGYSVIMLGIFVMVVL
ncbi:DMT family transporter [Oceanirhabdus sp. W0125-5]|uniref:DMT family transporter n=1 Tax=Oceanirhabdus sp. W0125-5 TaxID=2999116 RepID=UPI0022F32D1B|nr:DMT family transporter [Oceanirhabdus sp. W0125-5]WBW99180.1 DMT family transporter [Oceanirhabdus sp. W0125-5]